MPRLLLDQNMPIGLKAALCEHSVEIASRIGWATLENGALLAAAEAAGFDVMVTADSNIRYQQNLSGRKIALVVLSTNHWPTVEANIESVREAVHTTGPGGFTSVALGRPPLRRRPFPKKPE